jgi:plastocyanin
LRKAVLSRRTRRGLAIVAFLLVAAPMSARAQAAPVTADVTIARNAPHARAQDFSQVVVWLSPLDGEAVPTKTGPPPQIIQHNKTFDPHLVVVQVGQTVQFPNQDPFFHNIFSMYNGKRFDLGLYEAGSTRSVRFDRPGVSYLFCNIHSEMSAVVVALDTPYFAISDRAGHVSIPDVPDGRYQLHVWYERSLPDTLAPLSRQVTISSLTRSLGAIRVTENPNFTFAHKNKYGDDYVPPPSDTYQHP